MKTILKNERGMALVVALMLLVLLTVMGLAAISSTTTEVQITANERTDAHAFHAAEAGINEVLYRTTLSAVGASSIANGGSFATVNGNTFNAEIKDLAASAGNPDKDWQYNIYFTAPPAGGGSVNNVWSILPATDQDNLRYAKNEKNEADPVQIRYMREADLVAWGFANPDLNGDGDYLDLVYFNGSTANPQRLGSSTKTNGTVDVAPPAGGNVKQVVKLITATGHSGGAAKKIQVEISNFPSSPSTHAAVEVGIAANFSGNGWVSGFNHSEDTTPADVSNINTALYDNNGCDNYSGGAEPGDCKAAYGGAGNDPDQKCKKGVCAANYSGKATATGSQPAILATSVTAGGSFEAYGGTLDEADPTKAVGWQKTDPALTFPSIAEILGVDPLLVDLSNPDNILTNGSTTDPNACPSGLTYIDNAKSAQVYMPSKNCPQASGVMIVTGDMKITSQFQFSGLIYVMGDAELRGGTWILGALAVKGKTSGLKVAAGTPEVLYSKNAVDNAVDSALKKVGYSFTRLSWRESN